MRNPTMTRGTRSRLSGLIALAVVAAAGAALLGAAPAVTASAPAAAPAAARANVPMPTSMVSLQFNLVIAHGNLEGEGILVEREAEISGVPLAAVTATFLRSGHPVGSCEMTTNEAGLFTCSKPGLAPADWPDQVRVTFAGDELYAPSTAVQPVVHLR
ncbi:hypothetical protein [Streptomyces sp. NPDC020965]|uniref:hypothetical protein n=1 Tax=Streptomyces sp. NPDC020965 TaxID=3365105 RepID=UPI0037A22E1B